MKFCPRCGTNFEPDARFCLECGFDRSSIEPEAPSGNTAPQTVPGTSMPPQTPAAVPEIGPDPSIVCSKCGTHIEAGERFCPECGNNIAETPANDTPENQEPESLAPAQTATIVDNMGETEVQQPPHALVCNNCGNKMEEGERFCSACGSTISDAAKPEEIHQEVPAVTEVLNEVFETVDQPGVLQQQFCARCGTEMQAGERFCDQCGFDALAADAGTGPKPDVAYMPPISDKPTTAQPTNPDIETPQPIKQAQATPPGIAGAQPTLGKNKKSKLWPVLIVVALCLLAVAGWFAYTTYFATPKATPADTIASAPAPENALPPLDNTNPENDAQAEAAEPVETSVKSKTNTQVKNEPAKNKTSTQHTAVQNNQAEVQVEDKPVVPEKIINAKVILEIGRKEEPKNKNPKNPARLVIQKPTMITRITTDHFNNGMGTPHGGTITIKDRFGIPLGNYKAMGKTGAKGTPSAKWVAEPHVVLAKGTYFISDSDNETWSKTFIGSTGFVVVEGYEVE